MDSEKLVEAVGVISESVSSIIDLRSIGITEGVAKVSGLSYMSLGELIVKTENLTTHKQLRNIGDKKLAILKERITRTSEYKRIGELFR